jgi:hypothetical protein
VKKLDISKMMPKVWDLPEDTTAIYLPKSDNQVINLCDALTRKANMIHKEFRI